MSQVSNWNYTYSICDLKYSSQSAKCTVLVRIAVETSHVELLSAALAGPLIELLPKPGNSHRCTLFPTTRAHMWQVAFQFARLRRLRDMINDNLCVAAGPSTNHDSPRKQRLLHFHFHLQLQLVMQCDGLQYVASGSNSSRGRRS